MLKSVKLPSIICISRKSASVMAALHTERRHRRRAIQETPGTQGKERVHENTRKLSRRNSPREATRAKVPDQRPSSSETFPVHGNPRPGEHRGCVEVWYETGTHHTAPARHKDRGHDARKQGRHLR